MSTPSALADSCPSCHPGDHPAVIPHTVTDEGTTLRASYTHDACGSGWLCWWDAASAGWPVRRAAA